MSINLKKNHNQEYIVLNDQEKIGVISTYNNSFHANNCYIQLNLKKYDTSIACEMFERLMEEINRPIQVMVSSDNYEIISFIEKGGFQCRRKCYEMEVMLKDYIAEAYEKIDLHHCTTGSSEYDICSKLMFDYYSNTHAKINPLTAKYTSFSEKLPMQAIYQWKDKEIVNIAYIEENEIAYVCSKDKRGFKDFINTVIGIMFEKYETIFFECDDCDWAAMELCSLFRVSGACSYNTYIKDKL